MGLVASLQNDTKRRYYTDEAILPYLNMALDELQEIYQLNDIPITEESTSNPITCPAGTTSVSFGGGPALPSDLIEIKQLWESPSGLNNWTKVKKEDFIPHYLEGTNISQFLIYAWVDNEIQLLPAIQDIDLKLDYLKNIFSTPITINQVDDDLGAKFTNIVSYLERRTAAFCSLFIGE